MNIEEYNTKTYKITDLENIDNITVFIKTYPNYGFGNTYGEITVRCWDKAWHSSFSSIGCKSMEQFIASVDKHYLQRKFKSFSRVIDFDQIEKDTGNYYDNDFIAGMNVESIISHYGNIFEDSDCLPMVSPTDERFLQKICQIVIDAMNKVC